MHEIDGGFYPRRLYGAGSRQGIIFYTRYAAMRVIHRRSPNLPSTPRGVVKRSLPAYSPWCWCGRTNRPIPAGAVWSFRCRLRDQSGDRRENRDGAAGRRAEKGAPEQLGEPVGYYVSATRMAIRWNSLTASARWGWKSCVAELKAHGATRSRHESWSGTAGRDTFRTLFFRFQALNLAIPARVVFLPSDG